MNSHLRGTVADRHDDRAGQHRRADRACVARALQQRGGALHAVCLRSLENSRVSLACTPTQLEARTSVVRARSPPNTLQWWQATPAALSRPSTNLRRSWRSGHHRAPVWTPAAQARPQLKRASPRPARGDRVRPALLSTGPPATR